MVFLGLFAPMYSALFLMNEHGVPVWNSPAQAMIFLASSIGVAALLELVVVPALAWLVSARWAAAPQNNRWTAVIALAACTVVWYGWMWWIGRFGTIEEERAVNLFMGPYAREIFWNWTAIGLLAPILLLITPIGRSPVAQALACVGAVWGSYSTRIGILLGGEAINRSGAGYLTFHVNFEAFWYTGVSVLMTLGILAALLALMPRDAQTTPSPVPHKG